MLKGTLFPIIRPPYIKNSPFSILPISTVSYFYTSNSLTTPLHKFNKNLQLEYLIYNII